MSQPGCTSSAQTPDGFETVNGPPCQLVVVTVGEIVPAAGAAAPAGIAANATAASTASMNKTACLMNSPFFEALVASVVGERSKNAGENSPAHEGFTARLQKPIPRHGFWWPIDKSIEKHTSRFSARNLPR